MPETAHTFYKRDSLNDYLNSIFVCVDLPAKRTDERTCSGNHSRFSQPRGAEPVSEGPRVKTDTIILERTIPKLGLIEAMIGKAVLVVAKRVKTFDSDVRIYSMVVLPLTLP